MKRELIANFAARATTINKLTYNAIPDLLKVDVPAADDFEFVGGPFREVYAGRLHWVQIIAYFADTPE